MITKQKPPHIHIYATTNRDIVNMHRDTYLFLRGHDIRVVRCKDGALGVQTDCYVFAVHGILVEYNLVAESGHQSDVDNMRNECDYCRRSAILRNN